MNEKFTPGPWNVDHGVPGKPRVFSESDVKKKIICACEHGAKSRQDYDAALIAAAPEMYEKLNKLRGYFQGQAEATISNKVAYGFYDNIATKIDMLLQKARGEE